MSLTRWGEIVRHPPQERQPITLLTTDIATILGAKGLVKFASGTGDSKMIDTNTKDQVVQNCYTKLRLTASTADNIITMTRVDNSSVDNNCIDIRTIDSVSAIGAVTLPGYVYTGNFSGCVFYLYKTGANEVTGVHAYSGMVTTTIPPRHFWNKAKVNSVVREFGPADYYTRNPAQVICRYPTRGQLDIMGGEISLAFLSCVEKTSATTFLFSVRQDKEGARVGRLLETHEVAF